MKYLCKQERIHDVVALSGDLNVHVLALALKKAEENALLLWAYDEWCMDPKQKEQY